MADPGAESPVPAVRPLATTSAVELTDPDGRASSDAEVVDVDASPSSGAPLPAALSGRDPDGAPGLAWSEPGSVADDAGTARDESTPERDTASDQDPGGTPGPGSAGPGGSPGDERVAADAATPRAEEGLDACAGAAPAGSPRSDTARCDEVTPAPAEGTDLIGPTVLSALSDGGAPDDSWTASVRAGATAATVSEVRGAVRTAPDGEASRPGESESASRGSAASAHVVHASPAETVVTPSAPPAPPSPPIHLPFPIDSLPVSPVPAGSSGSSAGSGGCGSWPIWGAGGHHGGPAAVLTPCAPTSEAGATAVFPTAVLGHVVGGADEPARSPD